MGPRKKWPKINGFPGVKKNPTKRSPMTAFYNWLWTHLAFESNPIFGSSHHLYFWDDDGVSKTFGFQKTEVHSGNLT